MKNIKKVFLIGTKKRTSNSYGKNLPYMSYKIMCQLKNKEVKKLEDLFTDEELKNLSYWSKRSDTMAMTCWGTSQYFEAQLSLGRFLFEKQKKGEEWGEYTRRITALITE